jgi:hypothetical protein
MINTPMNQAALRVHAFLGNLAVYAAVVQDVRLLEKQEADLNKLEKDLIEQYSLGQIFDWQNKPLQLGTEEQKARTKVYELAMQIHRNLDSLSLVAEEQKTLFGIEA